MAKITLTWPDGHKSLIGIDLDTGIVSLFNPENGDSAAVARNNLFRILDALRNTGAAVIEVEHGAPEPLELSPEDYALLGPENLN